MGYVAMSKSHHDLPCFECKAMCCRYLAMEIDRPTSKREYDQIRWFLLHRNVFVFIDHDKAWYLEFETPCEALDPDTHHCTKYDERPRICREHGEQDVPECDFHGEEPHIARFATTDEFEAYLERKGIDWRWKS